MLEGSLWHCENLLILQTYFASRGVRESLYQKKKIFFACLLCDTQVYVPHSRKDWVRDVMTNSMSACVRKRKRERERERGNMNEWKRERKMVNQCGGIGSVIERFSNILCVCVCVCECVCDRETFLCLFKFVAENVLCDAFAKTVWYLRLKGEVQIIPTCISFIIGRNPTHPQTHIHKHKHS